MDLFFDSLRDLVANLNSKLPDQASQYDEMDRPFFSITTNEMMTFITFGAMVVWDDDNHPLSDISDIEIHIKEQIQLLRSWTTGLSTYKP